MRPSEWRAGWPMVLTATLGQCVAVSHNYSFGLFFQPLHEEFGWSRTLITFGLTIQSIVAVIGAPFVGALIDRVGSRRVALAGITVYCLSFASLSFITPSVPMYFALWTFLASSALFVAPTVWVSEVVRRFVTHRGMAIAIAGSGGGVGAITIPLLTQYLMSEFGWRTAYLGLAAIGFAAAAPAIFLTFGKEGAASSSPHEAKAGLVEPKGSAWRVGLSPVYLQLLAATILFFFCLTTIPVHLVPMAGEKGIPAIEAVGIVSLLGVAALVGRLGIGAVLDRIPARLLGAGVFLLCMAAELVMLVGDSRLLLSLAGIMFGASLGAAFSVVAFLAARIVDKAYFATLFGVMVGLMALCSGVSPLAAAYVFDHSGSYDPWFWFSVPTLLLAAILMATLKVPQPRTE